MLTSTWESRPKLRTPARSSPRRCCRMRRTVAASLSSALWTLADRSAATSKDCRLGVVWTWNPAREAVSKSTIKRRSPSESRARTRGSGGGKTRQMATMMPSARTPAPRNRGRVSSKPTVEGQPFGRHDAECGERDPGPDLELTVMRCLNGGGPGGGKGETVGGFELRDRVRKQVDAEPGPLDLARNDLLHGVDAGDISVAEGRDRSQGDRAAVSVQSDHVDRGRARFGHDRHRLVGMETVARYARRQHPFAQVLRQDGKRDTQRQVGFVQVEAKEHLPERLLANKHKWRLLAGDQRPAERRLPQVLASRHVHVLQVH